MTCRVDHEIPGPLAQDRLESLNPEFAAGGINQKDGDIIGVASIGGIEEFPSGSDMDIGASDRAFISIRMRTDLLQRVQMPVRVAECFHGPFQFVHDIYIRFTGIKADMAGTGAGPGMYDRIYRVGQRTAGVIPVETVNGQLVHSQVCRNEEPFIRSEGDGMDMGLLLSLGVGAFAGMLDQLPERAYGTIRPDRERGQITSAVIGDHQPFTMAVYGDIAGVISSAGLLVKEPELPALPVEYKGTDRSRLSPVRLIDCVKIIASRGEGQVRRIFCRNGADGCHTARGSIKSIYIDALAVSGRIGPDEQIVFLSGP
jgi:hypothetical protein